MRVVLDASAAIEIALDRNRAPAISAALADADEVLAPDLLVAEITNALWKYHTLAGLDLEVGERALAAAVQLPDVLVPAIELHREAFMLARTLRKPAYDMFYLALARREAAVLLTLDAGLRKEAQQQKVQILKLP